MCEIGDLVLTPFDLSPPLPTTCLNEGHQNLFHVQKESQHIDLGAFSFSTLEWCRAKFTLYKQAKLNIVT